MTRYLSLDWIDAVKAAALASPDLEAAAEGRSFGITEVILHGPEGDVTYHLRVDDGEIHFGAGPAEPEDVRFVQDWETAVGVATGTVNAQEAFLQGRIKLTGSQAALLESQPGVRGAGRCVPQRPGPDGLCLSCPRCRPTPSASRRTTAALA